MATNLLLEGDDLEALLITAQSKGGPNARIVRADKYRHGGLWGFFAKERFEVAVEIPEPAPTPAPAPAPAQSAGTPTVAQPRRAVRPAESDPEHAPVPRPSGRRALRTVPDAPSGSASAASAAPAFAAPAFAAARPVVAGRPVAGRPVAAAYGPPRPQQAVQPSWPGAALLDLADRADSGPRSITLPPGEPLHGTRTPAGVLVGAGAAGQAPRPQASSSSWSGGAAVADPSRSPRSGPTNGTVNLLMSTQHDTEQSGRVIRSSAPRSAVTDLDATANPVELAAIEALAAGELGGIKERPSPVHPSTSRPEFTALLDQLRDGARGPRPRTASRPVPRPRTSGTVDTAPRDVEPYGPPIADPVADRIAELIAESVTDSLADSLADALAASTDEPTDAPVAEPADAEVAEQTTDDEDDTRGVRQPADARTAADRRALRDLGVPSAWVRRLRSGDRFAEVLRMLERMPDPDIDPEATMVAVVGSPETVRLEAHRTAIDLATGSSPRPVVVVPATVGTERASAIAKALRSGPMVLAVETDGEDAGLVLDTLTTVQAGAVIAVVDAGAPLLRTQRWVDALGQVDALALDGAASVPNPAATLQLGLPVVRLDGVPVDRVTWAALLCAQLMAVAANGGPNTDGTDGAAR